MSIDPNPNQTASCPKESRPYSDDDHDGIGLAAAAAWCKWCVPQAASNNGGMPQEESGESRGGTKSMEARSLKSLL